MWCSETVAHFPTQRLVNIMKFIENEVWNRVENCSMLTSRVILVFISRGAKQHQNNTRISLETSRHEYIHTLFYFWYNGPFLHGRPWISPWIKSISNELDIIMHVIASQLSAYCDAISNRLWRHQQNGNRACVARKDRCFYRHLRLRYVV